MGVVAKRPLFDQSVVVVELLSIRNIVTSNMQTWVS